MKQTAVEWLWEQIDNTIPFQNIQTSQIFNGLLEQAKAMEKEQIINAYWDSYKEGRYSGDKTAEEYYNEIFKQE
jgi:HEPN domain-containing protein